MSDVTPFDFNGTQVRVFTIDGEPWWLVSEVGPIIGFLNSSDALGRHVDEEDKSTIGIADSALGGPARTIVNESGLYALIFGSRLPAARAFKKWVTSEVLPAIRRTGRYAIDRSQNQDLDMIRAQLDAIEADRARLGEVERRQDGTEQRLLTVESHLSDAMGVLAEFSAVGYTIHEGLPRDRPFLIKLGKRASALMRQDGMEPRKRDDISFGRINVYPVKYLEMAAKSILQ